MAYENPVLATPVLESLSLTPPSMEDAASEPVLDEIGNPLKDEKGGVIYGS
ncbi:MAG: hypothetical protein WCJ37_01180 [Syntrophus sp. (in: bacteria)]